MRAAVLAFALVALIATAVDARSAPLRLNVTEFRAHHTTNKKGLGVSSFADVKAFGGSLAFVYNWFTQSPAGRGRKLPDGVDYSPMLWGAKMVGNWRNDVEAAIHAGSDFVLGMNEPDLGSQSNMSPRAAAALWRSQIEPVLRKNPHVKSCSPAVTNGGGPSVGAIDSTGIGWLKQFLKACKGCKIDAICMHWYADPSQLAYFKSYFTEAQKTFKQPIMITEYGNFSGSLSQRQAFFKHSVAWLKTQKKIIRFVRLNRDTLTKQAAFGLDPSFPFVKNGPQRTYRDRKERYSNSVIEAHDWYVGIERLLTARYVAENERLQAEVDDYAARGVVPPADLPWSRDTSISVLQVPPPDPSSPAPSTSAYRYQPGPRLPPPPPMQPQYDHDSTRFYAQPSYGPNASLNRLADACLDEQYAPIPARGLPQLTRLPPLMPSATHDYAPYVGPGPPSNWSPWSAPPMTASSSMATTSSSGLNRSSLSSNLSHGRSDSGEDPTLLEPSRWTLGPADSQFNPALPSLPRRGSPFDYPTI